MRTPIYTTRGFSLIEVLIAVLILSIGVLGLAALQTTGLKHNQTAYLRSQATIMAQSMLDQLRSDPEAARDGAYNIAMGAATPSGSTLADATLAQWRQDINETFPDQADDTAASGAVSVTGSDPATVTVSLAWGERDDNANDEAAATADGSTTRTFQFTSRL